jgi:hypothetical protein
MPKKTLVDRIAEWREDDEQGYDTAIDLLCRAEDVLRVRKRTHDLAKAFLRYSLVEVDWDYSLLTTAEKALCTEEEFIALVTWACGVDPR